MAWFNIEYTIRQNQKEKRKKKRLPFRTLPTEALRIYYATTEIMRVDCATDLLKNQSFSITYTHTHIHMDIFYVQTHQIIVQVVDKNEG